MLIKTRSQKMQMVNFRLYFVTMSSLNDVTTSVDIFLNYHVNFLESKM